MKKQDIIKAILGNRYGKSPVLPSATAFASTNIALCKYWGKRDAELNLPITPSLSISLEQKGTTTEIQVNGLNRITVNGQPIENRSSFGKRLFEYVSLFDPNEPLSFHIQSNIPIGAGLASSASGFASLALALNQLYNWRLTLKELSILARIGSGSACRSLWQGFVEWEAGSNPDGMDSFAKPLPQIWPDLCIGVLMHSHAEKKLSSREAMNRSVKTSPFYSSWPSKVAHDLIQIKQAIQSKDLPLLGQIAESNALAMHALVQSSWPPFSYSLPQTLEAMQKIWSLRQEGLEVYFTQDAGPNLKLIFMEQTLTPLLQVFPHMEVIRPFVGK
jgi:diphosphomevalonate decarboxylase